MQIMTPLITEKTTFMPLEHGFQLPIRKSYLGCSGGVYVQVNRLLRIFILKVKKLGQYQLCDRRNKRHSQVNYPILVQI